MTSRRASFSTSATSLSLSRDDREVSNPNFQKLFASALDPQTHDHHQRHLALAKNVLFQNELGWKLSELPTVNDFILLLRDKVLDGLAQFADPLLAAVTLCSKPFVRQKANEEILNPGLLRGILPTLAQLLTFTLLDVQVAAAEALLQFSVGACLARSSKVHSNNVETSADDFRLSPRVFSQNLLEETGAVEVVVGVLYDLFPDDDEVRDAEADRFSESGLNSERSETAEPTIEQRVAVVLFPVMEIVYELSSHQRCAEVLVLSGALHYVVFVMDNITDPQDELLSLCIVVLWNVLELCHEKMKAITKCASRRELLVHFRLRNAAHFLGTEFTFHTLLHVFELLLARGYRKQDKELRNECLMVMHLLARRRRSLDFFYSTGLTASLLSYATAAETQKKQKKATKKAASSTNGSAATSGAAVTAASPEPAMPSSARAVAINADHHNYATSSDEDFEFKQMLWLVIAEIMCDHDANLRELEQFRFTEILLGYATAGWTDNERSGQHHAPAQRQFLQITALSVLNHIAPYILDHFYEIDGHRALLEFLQSSVMQSDEVLGAAWQLMTQVAPAAHSFQSELGRIGAVEVAIAAFAAPPSRHTFGIRRNAILACASMCREHEANRQRFNGAHGVHIVNQHLDFDPSHAVLEANILIAIVDAVRSCIVGDMCSESAFIDEDGVAKLLTVLERVPHKAVKNQTLAALAEICVNPAAIPSFLAWRSDLKETNNFTATQLLLRIYTAEDAAEELRVTTASGAADNDDIVALSSARHSAFKSVSACRSPFMVTSKSADDALGGDASGELEASRAERPQSPAFARLMEALKASQTSGSSQRSAGRHSLLELRDAESHPDVNLKAKIYAVLANVSFACDAARDKLTPRDQLMLEVAKEYPTFQIGAMWQNVHLALHAEGVQPVFADALYIRRHVEHAYNASVCTKLAQQEILVSASARDAADEQAFLEQILLQKCQEEQAEAFHRASLRQNSTLKLHFDAKRTRLEFLRKQDPTAFAAYESSCSSGGGGARIRDPPPACDCSDLNSLEQKEAELRGRLGTLSQRK